MPDDTDARLVVLGIDHPYSKEPNSTAEAAAKAILQSRGSTPRLFGNTLVFLAVDSTRLQDLDEAVRRYLAWASILDEKDANNLDPHQVRQAETQKTSADGAVTARLPEAYQWLLVPVQETPDAAIDWKAFRLSGQDTLAVRASKRLRNEELLVPALAGTRLRMELDRVPLWRGDHVPVKQLAEDFARYLYLPRLTSSEVLAASVQDGLGLLLWMEEGFAYADSFDDAAERYRGLRCGQQVVISLDGASGLLVKSDVALRQMEADTSPDDDPSPDVGPDEPITGPDQPLLPDARQAPKRFYGTVELNSTRVGRDAGQIADEVIAHIAGLMHADVKVTLEIEADIPDGAPENVVRTVTENSRTLKFKAHGFENE